jgi:DNA-binding transcriptional ArsR family regulator
VAPTTATKAPEAVATARLFRVLSDPTRVAILELLMDRPRNVSELVEATGAGQSRVSTHLACLRWCGFVVGERSGRNVVYSIVDTDVGQLVDAGMAMADTRRDHLLSCTRIGPDWA